MYQTAGHRRRTAAHVVLIEHDHAKTPQGRIPCDTGTVDASPDYGDIVSLIGH
jgi:hypothetical protein